MCITLVVIRPYKTDKRKKMFIPNILRQDKCGALFLRFSMSSPVSADSYVFMY